MRRKTGDSAIGLVLRVGEAVTKEVKALNRLVVMLKVMEMVAMATNVGR
jgi:hypothetical protein